MEVEYALKIKETGELARIHSQYNGDDRYACGEYSTWLTDSLQDPVFKVNSLESLQMVLVKNTPWYNTDADKPAWGALKPEELVPVKITSGHQIEDLNAKPPLLVEPIEVRDIFRSVAERYVGPMADSAAYVFALVALPEGISLPDLKERIGSAVFLGNNCCWRRLLGAAAVPEEYVPLVVDRKNRPVRGALLICSRFQSA
jgi:hypothetical protein